MQFLNLCKKDIVYRGIDYYKDNRVKDLIKNSDISYSAKVLGGNGNIYNVTINLEHPLKSECNCAYKDGHRRICKHIVATYLKVFPDSIKWYTEDKYMLMKFILEDNDYYEFELRDLFSKMKKDELIKNIIEESMDKKLKLIHKYIDIFKEINYRDDTNFYINILDLSDEEYEIGMSRVLKLQHKEGLVSDLMDFIYYDKVKTYEKYLLPTSDYLLIKYQRSQDEEYDDDHENGYYESYDDEYNDNKVDISSLRNRLEKLTKQELIELIISNNI